MEKMNVFVPTATLLCTFTKIFL